VIWLRECFGRVYASLRDLRGHVDSAAVSGNVARYGRAIGHLRHVQAHARQIDGDCERMIVALEDALEKTTTTADATEHLDRICK
jgi:hypothetical protein